MWVGFAFQIPWHDSPSQSNVPFALQTPPYSLNSTTMLLIPRAPPFVAETCTSSPFDGSTLGHTWTHLDTLGHTWTHLDSLGVRPPFGVCGYGDASGLLLLLVLAKAGKRTRVLRVKTGVNAMGCAASSPAVKGSGRLQTNPNCQTEVLDPKNLRIKLVLLGDSGVGKSCIALRFVRGQFDPSSKVTVGASFLSQTVALQDSTNVKYEIWDTAGQERYASLAPLYYRGAAAAVVVYDITNPESFLKAQYWVKELQKHGNPDMVMALVGNKADLENQRAVTREEAQEYAKSNGMFFIETSAKTSDNVNQLFKHCTEGGNARKPKHPRVYSRSSRHALSKVHQIRRIHPTSLRA